MQDLPSDPTNNYVSNVEDESQLEITGGTDPVYQVTDIQRQNQTADPSPGPVLDRGASHFPSSGVTQPCPDCICQGKKLIIPQMTNRITIITNPCVFFSSLTDY